MGHCSLYVKSIHFIKTILNFQRPALSFDFSGICRAPTLHKVGHSRFSQLLRCLQVPKNECHQDCKGKKCGIQSRENNINEKWLVEGLEIRNQEQFCKGYGYSLIAVFT